MWGAGSVSTAKIPLFVVVLALASSVGASASPGDLDRSFGKGGRVKTVVGISSGASDLAIQSDGKIVVVGWVSNTAVASDFAVLRYNTDGTRDLTFGVLGATTTDFGLRNDVATAVAVQSNGKIVVAGFSGANQFIGLPPGERLALARYNADGTPDLTFGGDGKVTNASIGGATDVAIQANGKIVVASTRHYGTAGAIEGFVSRYLANGMPDNSFGGGGVFVVPTPCFDAEISALAIQSDGKIVVAGTVCGFDHEQFAVARLNPSGSLDPTFGTDGLAISATAFMRSIANDLAIQSDGKIVVAGDARNSPSPLPRSDVALARYNADGTLDLTFGTTGIFSSDLGGFEGASAVATQPDGKVLIAGGRGPWATPYRDPQIMVARYRSDGALDGTFGAGGLVTTPFPGDTEGFATGIARQRDGRIVIAAWVFTYPGTVQTFGLARYRAS